MNKFSLFTKYGGTDTKEIVRPIEKKIIKLFDDLSQKEYSSLPLQFHIELRVDSKDFSFGDKSGLSNMKFFKKKNVIANTIALQYDLFENNTNIEEFIFINLKLALDQMFDKLNKSEINVDNKMISNDLNKGLEKLH